MAVKKRKEATGATEPPSKKSRTVKTSAAANPPAADNNAVVQSKLGRKRASDFLEDDEQTAKADKSPKKPKKSKSAPQSSETSKSAGSKIANGSLTADGVNGVVEHSSESEVEISTNEGKTSRSLVAEGLRTVDREEAGSDSDSDQADQGAALLAGFDSDTEDSAEDKDLDLDKTNPIPNYKKTSKKLRNAAQKGSDEPGTVYVGRIPHGFYEKQMRDYFSQFGEIKRLRLSRNRRTGASKHFAFVEFESNEVAKIVAETMDNYLMFGHILKCKYAPAENLHPDVWKGADKKFRKIPHEKLEKQKLEAPKTVSQWEKKNRKEQRKRDKNAQKLKEIGYEYTLPTLKSPSAVLEQRLLEPPGEASNVGQSKETVAAIEAPSKESAVPTKEKAKKQAKIKSKPSNPLTEGNLDAQNAIGYVKAPKAGSQSKTPIETSSKTSASTNPTGTEKPDKKKKKSSKSTTSRSERFDKGDFDNLSSIPIGIDAAGDELAQTSLGSVLNNIVTETGVADAELKKRKKERKRNKSGKSSDNTTSAEARADARADAEADADVSKIAPFAQEGVIKKRKSDEEARAKKVKGILKKKA